MTRISDTFSNNASGGDDRYRRLFDAIDEGFCIVEFRFDGPDGQADYRVIEANPAFYERTGFEKDIFNRWLREASPTLEEHWYETYGKVALTGEPIRFEQESQTLGRHFNVFAFRVDEPEQHHVGILFDDVTERKRLERQTELLVQELNHRSKNTLSLVLSIARQTRADHIEGFLERFEARLKALSASQDVLLAHNGGSAPFEALLRSQIAHFEPLFGKRIIFSGPDLNIGSKATQPLSLAVHELSTNAAKYGALANDRGRIKIGWSLTGDDDDSRKFSMSWEEHDGPPIPGDTTPGFGTAVTREVLAISTHGKVEADLVRDGLRWQFTAPAEHILA